MNKYIIGRENKVEIYDQKTFKKEDTIQLEFDRNIKDKEDARRYNNG